MKTRLLITKRSTFVGLLRTAGLEDVRYYLNGIFVEPDTGTLVTTNGHVLLAHRVPDVSSTVPSFIVPGELVQQAIKVKAPYVAISIETDEGADPHAKQRTVIVECGAFPGDDFQPSATFCKKEIDGCYPDWRRPFPLSFSRVASQFDPAYLKTVADALGDITERKKVYPSVFHNGPEGTALVMCAGYPETVALLMPWRVDSDEELAREATRGFGIEIRKPEEPKEPEEPAPAPAPAPLPQAA